MLKMKDGIASGSDTVQTIPCGRCPCCAYRAHSEPVSKREVVINIICLCLLLVVLVPFGYVCEQSLEHQEQMLFRNPIWHEPLEDW